MSGKREIYGHPTIRVLPGDEEVRMIGARSGLIHALVYLRGAIARHASGGRYDGIPQHHTAKRRAADAKVAALREVERRIDDEQKGCAVVLAGHQALSAGRQALEAKTLPLGSTGEGSQDEPPKSDRSTTP